MWSIFIYIHCILLIEFVTSKLIFEIQEPLNISLAEYRTCLRNFYKSRPNWSWVVMHEKDQKQPFDDMLTVIYKVGVPLYNYDETTTIESGYNWFHQLTNISTMSRESKTFVLSRSKFYINLLIAGSNYFRRGDKILFTNYNRGGRVTFKAIINFFGMKTSLEGLTSYNLLPIVSFLFVNDSGKVDPIAYIPTNRSDMHKAHKVSLSCRKLYTNSINKLIFHVDYFTISAFETVHAMKFGDEYFGRDAIIVKILVSYTHFPYIYSTPTDGATYGSEQNVSGVYKDVVKGIAQMAINSRLFLTEIITDNVVEYMYPYNRDDIVILIPIELSTSHLYYFSHYSYGISLAIITLLFFYFKRVKIKKSIIEVVLIFLLVCSGKSISKIDARYFRIIYMSMMILAFYGYTLFSVQILSALTLESSELTIKSVKEFVATKYKIFTSTTIKRVLKQSLNDSLAIRILPRIETPLYENETIVAEGKLLKRCTDYAVLCTRSTALYYMDLSNIEVYEFCYNIVPEAIMPSLVTYILGYRSPFQDKFNELFSRIIENGLVANYTNNPVKKKVTISDEVEPFGMSTPRERIAWIVYLTGISLSFFVFIIEVLIWPHIKMIISFFISSLS